MKSRWIDHAGIRIFFADYSAFGADNIALYREVEAAVNTICAEPEKSVLVLVNFSGTDASLTNLNVVRKLIPRANRAVSKRALLGVSGSRRFFINTFANVLGDTKVMAFDEEAQAIQWLKE